MPTNFASLEEAVVYYTPFYAGYFKPEELREQVLAAIQRKLLEGEITISS